MSELYKFEDVKIKRIDSEKYDEDEFMIARMDFLGTNPNSHKLEWDDDVFCESCQTFLGKWVVAEVKDGDATTHTAKEIIVGQIPVDQEIEFVRNEDGYLRAIVDVVLSKIYAKECCDIFENDDNRDVSVEIMCALDSEDENHVLAFKGIGVTILGRMTQPSSKGSNIKITRFSEEDANSFYHDKHNAINQSEEITIDENIKMAEEKKSYKINKTELKEIDWGSIDKAAMRDKIMEAKNRNTLVKAVYALVEDGWEDAPSEHLKYPLMAEIDGTFYYVKEALSSALAYAKQHNEQDVINKVEKLYKKFDLDNSEGKEEEKKMENIEFAAVEISDLWGRLWDALHEKYPDGEYGNIYCIDSIWEEDNKKFAIIYRRDEDIKYRLDFSLTEEGLELSEDIVKVEIEIVETDVVKKFAEPEDIAKYQTFAEVEPKDAEVEAESSEKEELAKVEEIDYKAECARLTAQCEEQAQLIMSYESELSELRDFKAQIEASQKMASVKEVLDKVKGHVDAEKYAEFEASADNYNFEEISAWKNIVFAYCGEHMINMSEVNEDNHEEEFKMSAPVESPTSKDVWERLKQKYN